MSSDMQLTAESLLSEAFKSTAQSKLDPESALKTRMADLEELSEFQLRKRTEFEQHIRKDYSNTRNWLSYANFEYEQHEMTRVRAIFERALEKNRNSVQLWIRYADLEVKNRSINHARNVLERAIKTLPFADKVWYQYAGLEESLANFPGVRSIFSRWIIYEPQASIYNNFISMETRHGNDIEFVRQIFSKYVIAHPNIQTWTKWASYEEKHGDISAARLVMSAAVDTLLALPRPEDAESAFIWWAQLEERQGELDRARKLFKLALEEKLSKENSRRVFKEYVLFEKKHGDYANDDLIFAKRISELEERLELSPRDYRVWWEYLDLVEHTKARPLHTIFEQVVKNIPDVTEEKSDEWRLFIMIWLRYVYRTELIDKKIEKTRTLYKEAIKIIPHKKFTFSKIWVAYAKFEIRQNDVPTARRILGQAIGVHPKPSTFKAYIALEKQLKEMDRVRKLYESYLIRYSSDWKMWVEYASLESALGDGDRARGVFDLAIEECANVLTVWFKYITFLSEEIYDFDGARKLFQSLLDLNINNVKVWIKWALFEVTAPDDKQLEMMREGSDDEFEIQVSTESLEKARNVFERGLKHFKEEKKVEERVVLLEALKQFEEVYGDDDSLESVAKRMPILLREEDKTVYKFPDDEERNLKMMKFLENAKRWRKQV